jgi:hypothetical protein
MFVTRLLFVLLASIAAIVHASEAGRAANGPFRIINIAPLLANHREELTRDLCRLHRDCGITDVAFIMPLHPEEAEPTMAKAWHLRDLFVTMREPLRGSGLRVGILIQSLIGHGTPTATRFQRIVSSDGNVGNSVCPLDPGFRNYVREAVALVAETQPEFLLVDDDFRLFHGGLGCFCPLHLAAFNKFSGGQFTRASLVQVLGKTDDASRSVGNAWNESLLTSLADLARVVRGAIDSADPGIPCGFCACADGCAEIHFAPVIAKILAGRQPPFVRVNNAWYLGNDGRGLLDRIYWTAAQMEAFRGIPGILSESDAYPHNRYCTPARALNSQIVFSLMHGATGAKLWITRTAEYEPDSGLAYREMLQRNHRRYDALKRLYGSIRWDEPATPLSGQPVSPWNPATYNKQRTPNWVGTVCGHMGIPCRVAPGGRADAKTIMLTGPEIAFFTDEELKSFLGKGLLLDGPAAAQLCKRGFAELLGVDAEQPANWRVNFERTNHHPVNGRGAEKKINISSLIRGSAVRLTARDPRAQTLSTLYRIPFYLSPDEEAVGPGLTLFENRLNGRVAVFAAAMGFTPFMDENRREQIVSVLGWLNREPLPVVVVSDVDIYARHGVLAPEEGGGDLLCVFNLNMDALPELRLRVGGPGIRKIDRLEGDGTWRAMDWRVLPGAELVVRVPVETMEPLLLRLGR